MQASGTNRQLNVCPTNVKEALEWLEALGNEAQQCAQVITQQILGSQNGHGFNGSVDSVCQKATEFMTAIKNGNGYTSTYQGAQWNQLCQSQTGKQCCATTGHGSGCSTCQGGGQHCQGCCKACPQQICARIFCLIVPVVESALECLQFMVRQNGHYSNNRDSIQAYLRALGFNSEGVQQVQQALRQQSSRQRQPSNGDLGDLISALHSATQEIHRALQQSRNIFVDGAPPTGGRSRSYSTPPLTTPTSAKDLMLWTIFLPYCCNYQYVHGMLRQSLLSRNGETQSGGHGAGSSDSSPLDHLMFGLHVLLLGMEAGGHGRGFSSSSSSPSSQPPVPPSTLFDGINMVSQGVAPYEYYTNRSGVSTSYTGPDQCFKLLVAGIPIISSAVEMLQVKYSNGGAQGVIYANGHSLEQALGFSGGNGMGGHGLHPSLGQHFFGYISSMVQQIKTAYANNQFQGLSLSIGTITHQTHSYLPTTFREMLLWLQGLPSSGGYKDIRTLLSTGSSSSSTHPNGQTSDPLVEIIFKLPYLFYSLDGMNTSGGTPPGTHSNGTMTGYITDLFERQGIDVRSNGATGSKPSTSPATAFSYHTPDIKQQFCAIVTIVYYVVDHLKRKYVPGGSSNLYDIGNNSLGAFLEFLGWNIDQSNGASAFGYGSTNLDVVLQYCFGTGNVTATGRGTTGNYLTDLFKQLRNSIQTASTSVSSTHSAPTTFRDTLLCLVGAPLTGEYESKKTELATAVQSKASSHSSNNLQDHITDTIVGVLQLFHKLEGNLIDTVMTLFGNGNGTSVSLRYSYKTESGSASGSSNNNLGHSIFGTTVVMRSVFGFLQQRCNRGAASGVVTPGESSANYSWKDCTVTCSNGEQAGTTTQCQAGNPLCKFLCLLGWDHTKRGVATAAKPGAKTTDTLTGSKFHTLLLKCFGDLASQDQGSSTGYGSYPYVTYNSNEKVLEKLYQYAVQWFQKETKGKANKGTDSSITPSSSTPSTIKDMMLWLIGLPLHSVYTELTKNGKLSEKAIQEIVNSRTGGANTISSLTTSQLSNSSQITNAIVSSSQGMIITMLAIEGSIKSVWDFLAKGLKTDNHTFNYGSSSGSGSGNKDSTSDSNAEACLALLVDYTYKVHFQLRFLLVMCNTGKDDGGWNECEYRGSGTGSLSSSSSSASLTCKCNGSSGGCPMPLYNFLCVGGVNKFKNNLKDNGTGAAEKNGEHNLRMGFSHSTHITTTNGKLKGSDIHALLKYFVDTVTEYKTNTSNASTRPLSLLAQCIVAIGERGPSTLGDCFEIVRQLGNGNLYNYVEGKLKKELKDITLEVTDGQNAENKQMTTEGKLITAIQNLFSNQHTDHESKRSLMSLMCTNNGGGSSNSCAPYMKSLSQGVYHYYLPNISPSNNFPFLQYLYDMLRKLLDKMKELKKEFEACECCKQNNCQGLISCQYAHPILYKSGFVFGSPQGLSGKTCDTLKAQLENVLSCEKGSESALFSAFECVIQVTYSILLQRAKGCVTTKAEGLNTTLFQSRNEDKTQWKDTFTIYVENAMYNSYPKLICTFACKVFDGNHKCTGDTCKDRFKQQIVAPTTIIPSTTSADITVFSSAVTTITAVIPQYTAPVIDPYHYRTFNKEGTKTGPGQTSTTSTYSFRDAIDFHVKGANCIRPAPVALRSVIDWILRVTTGAIATGALATQDGNTSGNDNENIKELSAEVMKVFQDSGMTGSDVNNDKVQQYVTDLVQGLRTFMGYEDRSTDVIKKVGEALGTNDKNGTNGKNGVKGALKEKIEVLNKFIGEKGSKSFGTELGKALLKGRYDVNKIGAARHVIGLLTAVVDTLTGYNGPEKYVTFQDVVKTFTEILKSEHPEKYCKDIKCTDFKPKYGRARVLGTVLLPEGLRELCDFFDHLQYFAKEWNSIGKQNGGSQDPKSSRTVVHTQKNAAMKLVKPNGDSSNNEYFNKLHEALNALGQCANKVQALDNNGNGYNNSNEYRGKITALIKHLKNEVLSKLKDEKETGKNNNASDPVYAVKGAEELIKLTKSKVEAEITKGIYTSIILGCYELSEKEKFGFNIEHLIQQINVVIMSNCNNYQHHLDDLKQLCQWLYRMGQLYAHGLKGFVESLIEHLKHINTVIGWIEKLAEHLKWLNDKTGNFDSEDRRGIVGLCKVGIENLLHGTYVLNELPDGNGQKEEDKQNIKDRTTFLSDLRLLALDRYTLQVWQDECNPKDSRPSAIKNWITFEGGIIRHSDLNAIKQQLSALTGIHYNSNTTTAASSAPSPTNRIQNFHAICVIQKFSYEAPIIRLERSLEKLKGIQGQLSGVKVKCTSGTNLTTEPTVIQPFCQLVSKFLKEPYGVYSFAKFVHTILGPNIFSAVIAALEELTSDKLNQLNGSGDKKKKFCGIIKTMCEGLEGEKNNTKDVNYTLNNICEKLSAFISTLRREYIFSYPVVTATATLPAPSKPSPSVKNPKCDNRDHSKASICKHCYPYLAKIFIGAIPNLYRHCRLLYEMCKQNVTVEATWNNDNFEFNKNGVYRYKDGYLSLGAYMSRNGWIVKGVNSDMDEKGLYELNPNQGISVAYGYLYDMLDDGKHVSTTGDSSLQPLDQLFKAVMQHFRKERDAKKTQREEKLKQEFNKDPNNKGIPFQPPLPPPPSTVRQVLFWLHEMDTKRDFYNAMLLHINTLCQQSSMGTSISHDTILHVLNLSITQCLEVLATIEDPGRQNAQYYYDLYTEEHYYAYPTVNIPLFFYTFVEKLMAAFLELNFVCVQCEFRATEGGWKDCEIGKAHQGAYEVQGSVCCICHERKTVGTPLHRVNVSGSVVCPRPLSAFLFSDQKNQLKLPVDPNSRLPYMSKGTMPCGFKLKNKAITDAATRSDAQSAHTPPSTSVTGSVLVEPLRKLVGGHVTGRHTNTSTRNDENDTLRQVIYLRDLLRYTLCLAVRPPWSMSENMAFFYRVTESWKNNKGNTGVRVALPNADLLGAIHAEIAMFPGSFDGRQLTSAVERFAAVEDNNKHQTSVPASPQSSHQYDLKTLMGCKENSATRSGTTPAKCSTFMFPLSLDVYTHYDHKNSRAYLSWILNFAFGIYGQLRGLEEMIKESACVRNASQSKSECPSLPMCPGVLTALYQSGSSFMDQGQLAKKENNKQSGANTTTRTCNDFKTVLTGLFNCEPSSCTPLHNLIVQCEAFLWSIRLPFSLVQLLLWSVAILFISYVFVVPLDHFKIKSHLFNRLKYTMHPSLLIADQQRRVSEVAYFSL